MDILNKQTADLAEEYKREGVVVVRGALTPYWLEQLREAVEEELKRGERYFAYRNMRTNPGTFQEFCLKSGIGRLVADIGGSDWTSLIFDQMFVKEPGTKTQTGWHTDQPYWPVAGPIMTTWIALDPVDADNGALEFIPGSHAWGRNTGPLPPTSWAGLWITSKRTIRNTPTCRILRPSAISTGSCIGIWSRAICWPLTGLSCIRRWAIALRPGGGAAMRSGSVWIRRAMTRTRAWRTGWRMTA